MKKIIISFFIILCIIYTSLKLYTDALHNAQYVGLPTVPCQDYTLPIKQNYSLTIKIMINTTPYLLEKNIGHDFGKCLHNIYTNDTTGKIYVKANDNNTYTLGQFFDVWHSTFTPNQILGYQTDSTHHLKVFINKENVKDYRNTPLLSNSIIEVIYQ